MAVQAVAGEASSPFKATSTLHLCKGAVVVLGAARLLMGPGKDSVQKTEVE